ncbi:DNA-binding protein WhiA [Pseudonocardia sp. EV170527-09]|uniref:DNA-binding protein WhiA n=1 Tax=Pseudonocardia sp. EV170527-09 TaxID=2603411 RepID=UPI00138666BF|nr:DNA-binding protein WhiA [Pseudonocardia sp. EV170527-09]
MNARRAATAAAATTERVRVALRALGDDVAPHLREAALLRLEYPSLSLAELGRLADPPLTKDTVAGRLRRLVRLSGVDGSDED